MSDCNAYKFSWEHALSPIQNAIIFFGIRFRQLKILNRSTSFTGLKYLAPILCEALPSSVTAFMLQVIRAQQALGRQQRTNRQPSACQANSLVCLTLLAFSTRAAVLLFSCPKWSCRNSLLLGLAESRNQSSSINLSHSLTSWTWSFLPSLPCCHPQHRSLPGSTAPGQ